MKHTIIGLGALLVLGASPAFAQNAAGSAGNWYVGAGAGWADPSDTDFDDSTAYKLFGGYRFTKQIGAELGYTNLGEFEDGDGELDVDGYQASVVGRFPFADRLSLLGRAGLYMWDAESSITGVGDDDGVDGVIGFGAEYGLGNQFALRAEWEWFSDVGETEVNVYSAGLTVDF